MCAVVHHLQAQAKFKSDVLPTFLVDNLRLFLFPGPKSTK